MLIATIGENMLLAPLRHASRSSEGAVATYVHNAVAAGPRQARRAGGAEVGRRQAKLPALGQQIAMHVAATNPLALTAEDLDPAAVERERAIFTEQARASGKPEAIIEKMVEGRLRKFYEEVALLKQTFVIDPDLTVEQARRRRRKRTIGAPIKITGFARYALGEGIDKETTDFAAEVAAAVKK